MADRKEPEITFDPHVFTRQLERNFDLDFVEETVRSGDIVVEKSDPHINYVSSGIMAKNGKRITSLQLCIKNLLR